MRKLVVNEWMSLDGVVQAPAMKDEDPSGGFAHGGWHVQYFDDESRKWVLDSVANAGGYLLGRRTFEAFAGYWPHAPEDARDLAEPLNSLPKHVASRSLSGPLEWENSSVLEGDLVASVTRLKEQDGADLRVIGSASLTRDLVANDLVDEFWLMIDPLVLGGGKRFLNDDGVKRALRLDDCRATSTGAILAVYATAG
jgi:dihydrofolate reductase